MKAPNTLALGDTGKSFIATAYAATAPAFAIIPAVLNVRSPNLIIGANGSVSAPNSVATPVANEPKILGAGLVGKSFIALAYALTASALDLIFAESNVYASNCFIFVNGSSPPNNPAIAPPIAPTAAPIPDNPSAAPNAAMPLL